MYKCQLQIYVWDGETSEDSENWIFGLMDIELPFVPYPELIINFPMQHAQKIKEVGWGLESNIFCCKIHEIYLSFGIDEMDFDEWKECLKENNWRVQGPYPKCD